MVTSAGSAEWIGVRVGLRGADLVLCRGGATQVISRSLGSKAGADMLYWGALQVERSGVWLVRCCAAAARRRSSAAAWAAKRVRAWFI